MCRGKEDILKALAIAVGKVCPLSIMDILFISDILLLEWHAVGCGWLLLIVDWFTWSNSQVWMKNLLHVEWVGDTGPDGVCGLN